MPAFEWYNPSAITFRSRRQVIWLIKNLSIIGDGSWPPEHRESGYSGQSKKPASHHAKYESAGMIHAELTKRLEKAGEDGMALEFLIRLSEGDEVYIKQRIANYQHRPFEHVHKGVELALRYIIGNRRKRVSYRNYCLYTIRRNGERKQQG